MLQQILQTYIDIVLIRIWHIEHPKGGSLYDYSSQQTWGGFCVPDIKEKEGRRFVWVLQPSVTELVRHQYIRCTTYVFQTERRRKKEGESSPSRGLVWVLQPSANFCSHRPSTDLKRRQYEKISFYTILLFSNTYFLEVSCVHAQSLFLVVQNSLSLTDWLTDWVRTFKERP